MNKKKQKQVKTPDPALPNIRFQTLDATPPLDPYATVVQTKSTPTERMERVLHENLSEFDSGNLSDTELSSLREICDRFIRQWGTDPALRIRDFVADDMSENLRQLLVRDLVRADIAQREKHDDRIEPADYLQHLGEYRYSVESAWWSHLYALSRDAASSSTSQSPNALSPIPAPRFRPIQLHARGGLGAVYKARDEELGRTVALKEIRPERGADAGSRARFIFEAEVTGSLEHPGIVPVYGFGRYTDDRPYYAMRFIRGRSFREAIETFHSSKPNLSSGDFYSLEFRALLRRFVDTCNAVDYAHEHGVLHRDIKPDNVMLGKYGETLVVDWGLAKLMDEKPVSNRPLVTSTEIDLAASGTDTGHSVVGTPLFMSPEQAAGERGLTPAADVYSLGAMLFNLISNQFAVQGNHAGEILANVRDGKLLGLPSLVPGVPRALVSICRQAMAMEPSHRYPSTRELAEDVERWMGDELVTAHVDSENMIDKAGRLFRRYRSWTFATAAALLLVTAISAASTLVVSKARSRERESRIAATRFKQEAVERYQMSHRAIDHWLAQSQGALEFFPGTQRLRRRLLQMAEEDYRKLAGEQSLDPDLELERARIYTRLGNLAERQLNLADARQSYEQARRILRNPILEHATPSRDSEDANVDTSIGITYMRENDWGKSIESFLKAEQNLQRLVSDTTDDLPRRYLAAAQMNHGIALMEQGKLALASNRLQAGIDGYAALQSDVTAKDRFDAATAREKLGIILIRQGDFESAERMFESVSRELEDLALQEPDHPLYADGKAASFVAQAKNYQRQGHRGLELAAMQRAVNSYRELRTAMPDVPAYTENLALALTDLGLAQLENDARTQAAKSLDDAETLLARLIDQYGYRPAFAVELATCHDAKGQLLLDLHENSSETLQQFVLSIERLAQLLQSDNSNPDYRERIAVAISHYAQALERAGDSEECRVRFGEAESTLENLAEQFIQEPRYLSALGAVYERHGRMLYRQQDTSAASKLKLALETWSRLGKSMSPNDQHSLAWLLVTSPVESVRDIPRAQICSREICERVPANLKFQATRALVQLSNGETENAAQTLQQIKDARGFWLGRDLFLLAIIQVDQGEGQLARETLQEAIQWTAENAPHNADLALLHEFASKRLADPPRP